ncbi:MAG: FAD-binding oxidoreductase [Knoellia sp.]
MAAHRETPARTRSWCGWGNVEDALTPGESEEIAARVSAVLPGTDLSNHAAPDPRSLPVAASRVALPPALSGLGSDDSVDRLAHSHGQAFRDVVRALRGELTDVPDLVVRPRTESDVVAFLDWASDAGVAVVPFGGGSSVVGGVEPRGCGDFPGVVSLDLGRLDRVLEVDAVSRAARVQAGVFGPDLEEQLRPTGLTLRHFPQSFEFSTVGGWLATRAGGHFATGYTHIDDLTESMRVVTPSGVLETRRLPGSGAGPSPDRLFLGSEGALGVITEAWLRLQSRPRWRAAASVPFADYGAGVAATRAIAQSGLFPSNCRLLDPVEAFLNAGGMPTTVLVLGFESAAHQVEPWMSRALELCRDFGGEAPEGVRYTDAEAKPSGGSPTAAGDTWRSSFLRMPYQRDALAARSMIVETFETACTWAGFEALRSAVVSAAEDAMRQLGIVGVVSCRFSHVYPDGPAPYFGVYAAGTWGKTVQQWDEIKAAVSDALIANGGTITHHHAVGRDHRPWYDQQRPELFAQTLQASKRVLDPAGILNPGVLID